jgi:proteic killer suppression protein
VIKSFRCYGTRTLLETGRSRRFDLGVSDAKARDAGFGSVPGIPSLAIGESTGSAEGRSQGQYGIPVNNQFRLCFRWTGGGPADVEIVDYV